MADGMSKRIKNALKTYLGSITYNGEQAFTSVLDSTSGEYSGYPIIRILPADMTTTKGAVGENDRSVNFVARVHLPLEGSTGKSESQIYDWMYDLTDLIIDQLDQGDFNRALETIDTNLDTLILNASRGDWTVAESDNAAILMCDVAIEIRYSRDVF